LCVLVSGIGCVYFLSISYFYIALEYFQVWFISTLIFFLDTESGWSKILSFALSVLVAIGWGATYFLSNTSLPSLHGPEFVVASLVMAVMPIFFLGGMLWMVFEISFVFSAENSTPPPIKTVELDLLLYMISLNVICFFGTNSFNNNLHMILDIRTMVMLFSGIYQEKDKMKLLQIPSFIVVMVIIMTSFVLFAVGDKIVNLIGDSLYILIGVVLFYETKKGRDSKNKEN
jgi:hypothetical protein